MPGESRDLAADLGCWDAAMLDGGGSTSLWVDGAIRNTPSDGSPRNLANHIGIVYAASPDPECPFDAGAWCEGSQLRTCNGGRLVNEGDCAAFGTACQEDGDWAFCVNPLCPDGDGGGTGCVGETGIESCTDGVYSSGDCAVFGLVCEAGACVEEGSGDDDDSAADDDDDITPPDWTAPSDDEGCSCAEGAGGGRLAASLGLLVVAAAGRRRRTSQQVVHQLSTG
ncbi:MAG: phosphodiester glycosidase family protein [Proteobacteria bacterium]|nr:phosphodiester glycosidase family protein [Pseudomonadota bacterium]